MIYPVIMSCSLILLATILHHTNPPQKFQKKYLWRSSIISFFNVLMLLNLEKLIIDGQFSFFRIYAEITQYSSCWLITTSIFYLFTTDFLFWSIHYILHNKYLYRYVHHFHHQVIYPTAFDFVAVHPIESLINWLMLHCVSFFIPIYLGTILMYGGLMSLFTILEHGTGLHYYPLKKIYDPEFHNIHHRKKIYNYGVGPFAPIWDHLLGTIKDQA
jgi:sterol desaturase/sphingolipid hydroxylase (fatty acid hydroxylase superfamily)